MRRGVRGGLLLALAVSVSISACDDPPKAAPPPPDASAEPPPPPPPPKDGCLRGATLDNVETDPACLAKQPPSDDTVRAAMKQIELTVTPDSTEVYPGSTVLISVVFRNTSQSEATLWLDARARSTGSRTDWSRIVGMPEPHPGAQEIPRLFFQMTTTDQWERDIDGVPQTGQGSAPAPVPLRVRIKPGNKLTHVISWVAVRIPAPAPMFQDDAGHRFYPKTNAFPLGAGDYNVAIDIPIFALSKEERKQTLRLKVLPHPFLDGGPGR